MKTKTIVIVQARMGSKRLPGKILKTIRDKSIIEHILTTLQTCKNIDKIYIATGLGEENKLLVPLCEKLQVPLYCGPEDDVLLRFCQVIEQEEKAGRGYDFVVRICADSPFLDAQEIDKLIVAHKKNQADLSINYNHSTGLPCGFGVEVISKKALQESLLKAETEVHHEHLDEWILQHPTEYKILQQSVPKRKQSYRLHFTVDYPEDLTFLQEVARYLQEKDLPLYSQNFLQATRKNPFFVNKRRMTLFVRVDGSSEIGMGHLVRSLTVCDTLKKRIPSLQVTFFTNEESIQYIQEKGSAAGYVVQVYSNEKMKKALQEVNPDMVLIDLRKYLDDASSLPLSRALRVRFIDTEIPQEVRADVLINSYPLQQFPTSAKYYAGLEYFPLRQEFATKKKKNVEEKVREILVLLGGGNLHVEQIKKIIVLSSFFPEQHFTLVLGSAMDEDFANEIKEMVLEKNNVSLFKNISNVKELMDGADMGISGGGNALFEFSCCGVPTISIRL